MKTKTDLYTKVVLTVIAVFLGIIAVRDIDFVTKAHANTNEPLKSLDVVNVNIESIGGKTLWRSDFPLKIRLEEVNSNAAWDIAREINK